MCIRCLGAHYQTLVIVTLVAGYKRQTKVRGVAVVGMPPYFLGTDFIWLLELQMSSIQYCTSCVS